VNAEARPKFGKGVKLRHEGDGSVMLLVPEGALMLNRPAAAALELVDGRRTLSDIIDAVVEQFDVTPERARADLRNLFERLAEKGFLRPLERACPERSRRVRGDTA
jgi:pyrroloquinoline quinone biosynthesis protein D